MERPAPPHAKGVEACSKTWPEMLGRSADSLELVIRIGNRYIFFDQGGRHQSRYTKTTQIQITRGFFIPKVFSYLRVANYLHDTLTPSMGH